MGREEGENGGKKGKGLQGTCTINPWTKTMGREAFNVDGEGW